VELPDVELPDVELPDVDDPLHVSLQTAPHTTSAPSQVPSALGACPKPPRVVSLPEDVANEQARAVPRMAQRAGCEKIVFIVFLGARAASRVQENWRRLTFTYAIAPKAKLPLGLRPPFW
jgi:hypothetical protein